MRMPAVSVAVYWMLITAYMLARRLMKRRQGSKDSSHGVVGRGPKTLVGADGDTRTIGK